MPAPRMSMNVLLSLIIQSKITGKGVTGNGRLLVKLLRIIADNNGKEITHERNILACFNDDPYKPSSYHKIDKLIGRFLPEGRYYPYSKLTFLEYEKSIGRLAEITVYIKKMQEFCDKTIADDKLERMVNTLVEIIRQDQDIDRILYGAEFIKKADLIGTPAHPKKLCYPALLLGLLYYVHQHHTETPDLKLMDIPEKPSIRLTRHIDNDSLDLKIINDPIENVLFNSKRQIASKLKYPLELSCNSVLISEIPEGDVLITGLCGIGKTSLLNSIIGTTGSADLQLELHSFSSCIIERYSKVSCWILLNILLKYCYQGEYRSFESCCALEGEETVLLQLSELENDLKLTPINKPKYTLMLDGQNEILLCQQDSFAEEIDYIHKKWKNVRIIITGRNIPDNSIYHEFKKVRIIGIPCDELKKHNNGLICNLDFGGLYLPPVIPAGVRFSLDGEYPCAFYDCTVQISRIKGNEDNVQIFKECDFSGAKFLDIECRDTIIKMGGICDKECEYMDGTYAEIVRTWHDVPKWDEI